ncbi:glutathione S-transferase T2-like [Spinacia oleracea]|uniref:Glutathione S-transferase T2-like n=1 Tax=Spinacia oleracea TaxID=3562 RepID=A0ABM3R8I8_SPIOL|nr:glutathione S-transferase T2-like [Spinacia oleracea]
MSQGENVLPSFNNSYRETAVSEDDNDDDDVVDDDDDDDVENEGGANSSSRRFWLHAEDEVLVKAWLEVSCNKKTNTKQKGAVFWGKIEKMFDNVRLYKEKLYNEGVIKSDLLKVRNLEQLRSRWKRVAASCAKFSGAYAMAVERRASGWEPVENIVDTCKKNTSNQGNNSKRSRINEAGNYSSSTNPDTPTSGDIGCFGFPLSDRSCKNKGKNKVMNVPSESFQQWLDVVENMNITRQSETEMERERLKYEREREVEKTQLEREKEARKQRKINMELFKILEAKPYLSEEDQERRNNLARILFP